MKIKLTQERLKELLYYNQETGIFTRKITTRNGFKKGRKAGYLKNDGYVEVGVDKRKYMAHRLVWLYIYGYLPENEIDHINRDKSDNRILNIRHVTRQCNLRNILKKKNNTSGVTGVRLNKKDGKWSAHIGVSRKNIYLGRSNSFSEMVKMRWEAEVEHGFPNCNTTSTAYEYLKKHNLLNKDNK